MSCTVNNILPTVKDVYQQNKQMTSKLKGNQTNDMTRTSIGVHIHRCASLQCQWSNKSLREPIPHSRSATFSLKNYILYILYNKQFVPYPPPTCICCPSLPYPIPSFRTRFRICYHVQEIPIHTI